MYKDIASLASAQIYIKIRYMKNLSADDAVQLLLTVFAKLESAKASDVLQMYNNIVSGKVKVVEVITAKELSTDEVKKAEGDVVKNFGDETIAIFHIDPNMLGGVIIRCGDYIVDHSIKSEIEKVEI